MEVLLERVVIYKRASQDPSLSRLPTLLSIDLLHGADHQTEEQEIHLRVLHLQLQGHSSFDKSPKNCTAVWQQLPIASKVSEKFPHLWSNLDVHGEVLHDVDVVVVLPHVRHLHQLLVVISLQIQLCPQNEIS